MEVAKENDVKSIVSISLIVQFKGPGTCYNIVRNIACNCVRVDTCFNIMHNIKCNIDGVTTKLCKQGNLIC